ncbi:MAG TPA: Holliday junction resolvase RuvX [Geminicoccus sp.]|uniref:Holliday junction resolvase RuvX n=1 Tax=Geminicoccus sp. TaxID=2024832 RepID=UPI002B8F39BB|nr:Holliday junction resolvase RuvX [Geminicoccus sp.]HWL70330.1 Holliday junction resolvase RuvX [Geminicoccus sp.]
MSPSIFRNHADFAAALPKRGGLLALDVSKRAIGLAGTDAERRMVTPLFTHVRKSWTHDREALLRLLKERRPAGLVVGWPLGLDDREGEACDRVRNFLDLFVPLAGLPVFLQDERFTTGGVEAAIEAGELPPPGRDGKIDHLAAALILAEALRSIEGTSTG